MTDDPARAEDLLRDLERMEGAPCLNCRRPTCGHEAVMSVVLGFKGASRCAPCLAAALGRGLEELRDQLIEYIERRDCFRTGWLWAGRREGGEAGARPACLWPPAPAARTPAARASNGPAPSGSPRSDREWDAGDLGCGDLVLELRMRLQAMDAGEVLRLTARDPAAPEDIPAWCRLTGNALVSWKHPVYHIRKEG